MSYKGKERERTSQQEEGEREEMEEGETQPDSSQKRDQGEPGREDGDGGDEEEQDDSHSTLQDTWIPKHVLERPKPPTREEREAELALLEAQARAGQGTNDPRARARVKPRKTIDYFGPIARWKLLRSTARCPGTLPVIRPQPNYVIELLPPSAYGSNTSISYCTKYAHTSTNKVRTAVNVVKWTPDGRRVLTGSNSGEFTLWNGLTFNFETILQAHDNAIRAAEWSYSGSWLVSCDNGGVVKYFQPNMNNVTLFSGHSEPIRDISFAPDDMRFCTGSDDGSVKIWDFERREMEKSLTGHGYDVRCVKWHPTKSLLVSGSKNNLIKFWDPRTGTDLRTLHDHKNGVQAVEWSPNGNMVASASRDQSVKVFDIRMMKELQDFRGHAKDVCSVAWHPIQNSYLVSGGSDGSIHHWQLDQPNPVDSIEFGHDSMIWAMAFHPLGHLLATGSNDHTTRWWSRGRPGVSIVNDRFHVGREKAKELGVKEDEEENEDDEFATSLPGLHGGHGYNNNNRYQPQHNQYNANTPHYTSATAHLPAFAMPTAGGMAPPIPAAGGGFSIPGLEAASKPVSSGGIPGLAAAQQAAQASQNPGMSAHAVAAAYGNARTGHSLPSQQDALRVGHRYGGNDARGFGRGGGGPDRDSYRGGYGQGQGQGQMRRGVNKPNAGKFSNAAASERYKPY